jgi:hypothetical protein
MDEKTFQFLKLMREQVRGKNSREVHSGHAGQKLGIAPGSRKHSEYEARLNDLVQDGHLEPHPERTPTEFHRYLITDKGVAAADEREPQPSTPDPQEDTERLSDMREVPVRERRPWWRIW